MIFVVVLFVELLIIIWVVSQEVAIQPRFLLQAFKFSFFIALLHVMPHNLPNYLVFEDIS